MKVDILNSDGKVSGKADLPDHLYREKLNRHLVHEVVTAYLSNQRMGTHSTLTRSEVQGSGKKPWKQKHTGRARAGTSTSPLWRGGGIIFGPKPRSYRVDLPKAKIKSALFQLLSAKVGSGAVIVSEKPQLEDAKTKKIAAWLKKLSLPEKSLLVLEKKDEKLSLASRNLNCFRIMEWRNLHPYHILESQKIIFTPEALTRINAEDKHNADTSGVLHNSA